VTDPTEQPSFSVTQRATDQPVAPRDAATVIVARDASAGIETFMLRRHLNSDFVGGAYVFPGGTVDPEDRDSRFVSRIAGIGEDLRRALGEATVPLLAAAFRETFEEAGILLARDKHGTPVRLLDDDRWGKHRADLNARTRTFLEILEETEVILDATLIRFWSRIVTPLGAPKRYDARFFVARMPEGQEPLHDDVETTASVWVDPGVAAAEGRAGKFQIIFPTRRTLEQVDEFSDVDQLLAAAHDRDPMPLVPEIVIADGVPRIRLDDGKLHEI
jgi:8-oxo-dGTP pyrophosphatase MutT (NUDIX family)